jgi:hypothetical protein
VILIVILHIIGFPVVLLFLILKFVIVLLFIVLVIHDATVVPVALLSTSGMFCTIALILVTKELVDVVLRIGRDTLVINS